MQMLGTSLEAYQEILSGLNRRQREVFDIINTLIEPKCNYQIAAILHWPINAVTGRVKELRAKELVVDDGKRPGPPQGRSVHYWRAKKIDTLF